MMTNAHAGAVVASMRRAITVAVLGAGLVADCGTTSVPSATMPPVPSAAQASPSATPLATSSSSLPTSSEPPDLIPACIRQPDPAGLGVLDQRPESWYDQGEAPTPSGFPDIRTRVYGPQGLTIPPFEGPGRIVLYESFPANPAYFESRIEESRRAGGTSTAATVCGEATEVWLNASTGELIVGWTDRDKSDVLVANVADFTMQQLIESAERVYDCCG
jgi:hypothetical protein